MCAMIGIVVPRVMLYAMYSYGMDNAGRSPATAIPSPPLFPYPLIPFKSLSLTRFGNQEKYAPDGGTPASLSILLAFILATTPGATQVRILGAE